MPPLVRQILRRGLIAAGVLAAFGFVIAYLVQSGIDTVATGSDAPTSPAVIGLVFGTVGFVMLVVLELLAALFRLARGKMPAETLPTPTETPP